MKMLRDPLFWLIALFVALIFWLPYCQPLFAALFPQQPRPVYQQSETSDYRLDPLRRAARPAGDTCRAGSD